MRFLLLLNSSLLLAQIPFPPIGPDVTGGTGPGGYAHDIPAKRCYNMTPIDTSWNGPVVTATGSSWASGVVTVDIPATPFNETSLITLSGWTPAAYNGTYGLGSKSSSTLPYAPATGPKTSLTFLMPNDPGGAGTGGTVQFTPQIAAFDANNCYSDLTLPRASNPSPWSGILHTNRAIDWSTAGSALIDEVRASCGATLFPSGTDDGPAINGAIAACGTAVAAGALGAGVHGYVLLGPGLFQVSKGILFGNSQSTGVTAKMWSNVTLRGSGPLLTTVHFTGSDGCSGTYTDICINNKTRFGNGSPAISPGTGPTSTNQGANAADWKPDSGYTKGTTTVTLSKTLSGLVASSGATVNTLILDQPNDEYPINPGPAAAGGPCNDILGHSVTCGATESGTTVTITTSVPHNFTVGQSVWVDNVQFFTIAGPAVPGLTKSDLANPTKVKVTTGGKFTTAANTLAVGQQVCITSGTAGYSGHHTIETIDTVSHFWFTYEDGATPRIDGGWGIVDACYSNSAAGGTPYTITAIPTLNSFEFTHTLSGLGPSGQNPKYTGYPATASGDTGGMLVCQTGGICRAAAGGQGTEGRNYAGMYRSEAQMVDVVGVSGPTITTSPGLYGSTWGNNNKTAANGRTPGVYWVGSMIVGVGIEDMTLDHTDSIAASNPPGPTPIGIKIVNAYDCFVKNVRSIYGVTSHIRMIQSSHITIAHSYFYGVNHNSHTGSYGLDAQVTTGNLFINNIFNHVAAPMTVGQDTGTVYAYNYDIRPYSSAANYLTLGSSMHDAGSKFLLYEGNDLIGFKADYIHGTDSLTTFFRNYNSGTGINLFNGLSAVNSTLSTIPVYLMGQTRYFNAVGNVLGTPGYHGIYESSVASGADPTGNINQAIYTLGWGSAGNACNGLISGGIVTGGGVPGASLPCSDKSSTTLMRWGNYDTVTGPSGFTSLGGTSYSAGPQWNSTEVPTADPDLPNAVPGSHTLPDSFFLTAQPGFWTLTSPAPPTITSLTIPPATIATPYTTTLTETGGTGPFTWAILTGAMPPGLSFDPSTGIISGTPTTAMNTTATIQIMDAVGRADAIPLVIVVKAAAGPLTIFNTGPLPDGIEEGDYPSGVIITVTGGTYISGGTYIWAVSVGALPPGLTLNTADGAISGTSDPGSAGTYSFTVRVTDGVGAQVSHAYTITIAPLVAGGGPSITTTSLPNAQVSVPYSFSLSATSGQPPYTWSISAGTLWTDFGLDPATGVIRGLPTTATVSTFTVQVTDTNGDTDTADLTLTVLNSQSSKKGTWSGRFK